MKLIDVDVHLDMNVGTRQSTIKVTARFEDIAGGSPATIELKDWVSIESGDMSAVVGELERLIKGHPYFKLKLCESPIELKFFVYAMHLIPNLRPQVTVGPYRVDLAIPDKRVAIELDGHEFHKTQEQRTCDAKRERYLQKQGWQVIRYTGSEIHRDLSECINDAIQIIAHRQA